MYDVRVQLYALAVYRAKNAHYGTRLGVRKQRVAARGDEIYCAYGVGRWFHWVRRLEHGGLESFGRES